MIIQGEMQLLSYKEKEIFLVSNATCTWFPRRANEREDEAECICQIGGDAVEEAHREQAVGRHPKTSLVGRVSLFSLQNSRNQEEIDLGDRGDKRAMTAARAGRRNAQTESGAKSKEPLLLLSQGKPVMGREFCKF